MTDKESIEAFRLQIKRMQNTEDAIQARIDTLSLEIKQCETVNQELEQRRQSNSKRLDHCILQREKLKFKLKEVRKNEL